MKECEKKGKKGAIYATRKQRETSATRVFRSGRRQIRSSKHLKVNYDQFTTNLFLRANYGKTRTYRSVKVFKIGK